MYIVLAAFLAALVPEGSPQAFDLMTLRPCSSKGRFQDLAYSPNPKQAQSLLALGPAAIPLLISRLESTRPFRASPVCLWPAMVEGDMAQIILMDLFLDDSWKRATLPEACWSSLKAPGVDHDLPAYEVLRAHVLRRGRRAIRQRWTEIWESNRTNIQWDPIGRYFRVGGLTLATCE
jgi:hypothetical protein